MHFTPILYLIKILFLLKKLFNRLIKIFSLNTYVKNITYYVRKLYFILYLEIVS